MSRHAVRLALVIACAALGTGRSAAAQDAPDAAQPAAEDALARLRDAYRAATGPERLAAAAAYAAALEAAGYPLEAAGLRREVRSAAPTPENAYAEARAYLAFAEQMLAGGSPGSGIRAAFEDARLALLRARELGASGPDLVLGIARCAAAQGDAAAEIAELEGGLAALGDDPRIARALAFAYQNAERFDDAVPRLRALSDAAPEDLLLARALSYSATRAGDEALAVAAAERAIAAAPRAPEAWQSLWSVYSGEKRYGELARAVVAAAERYPDDPTAAHYAGFACASAQRADDALLWLRRAWELDPANETARLQAARVLLVEKRDTAGATALYQDVLARDPQNAAALDGLAFLAVRLGAELKHEEALPLFEAIARARPDDGASQANYALALRWAGRYPEALRAYERAEEVAPDDAQIRNDHGLLLSVLKRDEDATRVYVSAHEIDPLANDGLENMGFMAREAGDLPQALHWFRLAWEAATKRGRDDLEARHRRNLDDVRFPLPPVR